MNIILYGNPYHLYKHIWLNSDDIKDLYLKYNNNIVNYIDGVFAIVIKDNDNTIVITDYYGYYPLFYNKKTKEVCKDIDINDIDGLDKIYNDYINNEIYNLSHNILNQNNLYLHL